jgi:hypothetical protein
VTNLWLAVLADMGDMGTSLLVTANAPLLLLRVATRPSAPTAGPPGGR